MKKGLCHSFIVSVVRLYLALRRILDGRFLDRALIRIFNGVHPKNVFNYRHEFFLENVGSEDVVIDIGCGTGLILSKISSRIKKGYGLDMDLKLSKFWKVHPPGNNIELIQADLSAFNFGEFLRKTKANTCILSHILEHVKDAPMLLKQANAQCLLICVPSQENWRTQLLIHFGITYKTDEGHYREYTRQMLCAELAQAGYRPVFIGFNAEGEIICRAEKQGPVETKET